MSKKWPFYRDVSYYSQNARAHLFELLRRWQEEEGLTEEDVEVQWTDFEEGFHGRYIALRGRKKD